MKNRNGFTLVELMAVIVVIGILTSLAIPVYHTVTNRIKEKEYQNKVTFIETKAEKYANDRSIFITSVQELVDEGYLDVDNDAGDVLNPVDQSRMNCDIIVTEVEEESFHANLTEEKDCSKKESLAIRNDLKLTVITKNNTKIDSLEYNRFNNRWEKDNVRLEASLSNEYQEQKISWMALNDKIAENSYSYETNTKTILNNIFTVMITAKKNGKDITLSKSVRIKVDKQAPSVDPENSIVLNNDVWGGPTKELQIVGMDYNGSGIAEDGYYIGTKVTSCNNVTFGNIKSQNYGLGTYSMCVKDAVGNVSKPYDVAVKNIDNIPPVITAIVEKNDVWTNSNKKIIATGTDHSGIKGYYFSDYIEKCPTDINKYYSPNTVSEKKGKYSICAVDKLGNITPVPTQVEVKMIDTTPPRIVPHIPEEWVNKGPVKVTFEVYDDESGVDESSYEVCSYESQRLDGGDGCKKFSGNSFTTNYYHNSLYIKDKAGNQTYGSSHGPNQSWGWIDVNIDHDVPYTPYIKEKTNNITCTKNAMYSFEDNECKVSSSSFHYNIFALDAGSYGSCDICTESEPLPHMNKTCSDTVGYYMEITDFNGNVTLSKKYIEWDIHNGFTLPKIYRNRIGYIWAVDEAGNVSPGKLIIRVD